MFIQWISIGKNLGHGQIISIDDIIYVYPSETDLATIGTDTTNNNGATNRNNVSARKRATKRTLNDRSSTSLNGSGLVGRVHVLRKLGSNSNNNDDPDASLESFDHLSIDSSLNNTNMEDGNEEVQNVNDISAISDRSEDDIDDL